MRGEETHARSALSGEVEIPPRARRRGRPRNSLWGVTGNTSACAEKSSTNAPKPSQPSKYLRVRGEEGQGGCLWGGLLEIPPRARRRGWHAPPVHFGHGNTSACAEKRMVCVVLTVLCWKYLRVRGEEFDQHTSPEDELEIPPRARRRDVGRDDWWACTGNTSACAEKRTAINHPIPPYWKYLRVRGEELPGRRRWSLAGEIPPRARRRAAIVESILPYLGNTSACAEKRASRRC